MKFSARSLSLLLIFLLFVFNNVLATVNTHNVYLIKYLPPKFNVMFKFNYSKYNPRRGLIFGGGAYTWKKFPFQKLIPKHTGAYIQWGLLSEFYGISKAALINYSAPCAARLNRG